VLPPFLSPASSSDQPAPRPHNSKIVNLITTDPVRLSATATKLSLPPSTHCNNNAMNLSLGLLTLLSTQAAAFAPIPSSQQSKSTALHAEKRHVVAVGTSAFLLGLGLSAQMALAADTNFDQSQYYSTNSAITSSTIMQSAIDEFSLPSYDSAKGQNPIDLTDEVQSVNKKTQAAAKAKREYVDTSKEKMEMDELRRLEKDSDSLFGSMTQASEKQRQEQIKAEIEESRANRWKTF